MEQGKPWLRPVAARLRQMHDATEMTGKALAMALGCAESKVTRVRGAVTEPTEEFATAWAHACHVDDEQVAELLDLLRQVPQMRRDFADGQAGTQKVHTQAAAAASLIRYFEMSWIPGLLQTRDYLRCVLEDIFSLHGSSEDIDAAIAMRMRRQQVLLEQDKRFQFLIEEPALCRDVFPADVMVPQLHYLLTWLDAPNVEVAILPVRAGAGRRRMVQSSFQMYDDRVIVEGFGGEDDQDKMHERFARVFEEMWGVATVGRNARGLILRAADAHAASASA